ncbi:2-polyprenylphenol hydroxylase and related flavodoxin oxidoreductases / CDP-6-deoxy-delta-3,4-glucoseen reductase-like protein [Thioalkalivibrio nitratireducens DSM 14787]|uniref:2-polyprenylphenol hydroxylase and related flavodoxin oxidoreductases / CDP-6-deoxy-delta-3,4-glucoseen reductase-like protein n=1 Tax=Thioalkalivibrio nitratireducens (strain DSM 14787 / UNIQEM 213 / ALEN2) TaxID=1255043 RepID=L0DZV3_THIND|nr:2Fe-2S iron-sulfur cluster-binding protein [Thioalkalivibrio nitratireducens]AGA34527.1 2-polyprenylphenol hydroxylase and related flavodoxin oxidoreductases / CDP-6-deoxy-delta-3,4-glucoseen reductase-like protein [Thioalkalivibrio nitratireducens DSM 14787]
MEKQLSVIRAARLAGVTRGELQTRIKCGDLPSFDGTVRVDDLLSLYPGTRLEDERTLERVDRIKAAALGRDVAGRSLPEPQVLAERLAILGHKLTRARRQAEHYAAVFEALESRLRELEKHRDGHTRAVAREIKLWMQSALHQGLAESDAMGSALADRSHWMSVMAPQVRLLPDHQEFLVEGSDTVLDAALRAGLSISYGCSNGNCGECKARVVSGEIREVRPHDYVIPESERAQGYALMCAVAPVTDLVVEVGVARSPDQIPLQTIEAMVRDVEHQGTHVRVVRVQTPRTRRLRFLGGQYVRVRLDEGRVEGRLPLANCPCDDRNLVLHVAEDREDAFAVYCFERLRKGERVEIEGPYGDFVIGDEVERPLVFLACDTGFAPIKSLIEHVIALDIADAMDLVWLATGAIGHYEDNLCRSWDDALDNFRYKPVRVNAASDREAWPALIAGSLSRVEDPSGRDYYVAGPGRFVDAAAAVLDRLGVPPERRCLQGIPPAA